ncbi:MAG: cytochrome c [Candidatus Marinimicrobia bacterium]|jgi:cytochrome c556|nr:cytochrome c [Candidatus Neomarinimicrobiota bacterium]MBT3479650.1 cytochrome c [Candidatus Neomarinimicrobiota bacterium]MBT3676684.1 cytochrome c [Candidatus Neomarinimicrobiota bacterium]MBT3763695.1 cytochrome c [Candidatus Neomarinimicrobiota bacterium]MBT4809091.1 cytochrome c [Candidatus Neomarinimicrobiota bacterium]
MNKKSIIIISGIILLVVGLIMAKHHYGDHDDHGSRIGEKSEVRAIDWTPSTRNALMEEMRSINKNYQELVSNLSQGEWKKVIENSHNIHSAFILKQELSEEDMADLHRILPERFIEIDSKFHDHALKLAMAAKAQDGELASMYLGKMMEGCLSCHQVYAKDRFEGFSSQEEAIHEH